MAASLSGEFNLQEFTDLGDLAAGWRLYTYAAATTTQKTAYTDPAGAVPHTYTSDGLGGLYIALNSRGELPAPLFLSTGGYDIALKTTAGVTVWTRRAIGTDDSASTLDAALRADLAASSGSTLVNFLQSSGTSRTIQSKLREFVHATDFAGYDSTGATSSNTALVAADSAARSAGKPLLITGTPLLTSTFTLTAKTHWVFGGAGGRAAGDLPPSYLLKASTLNGPALVIPYGCDGVKFEGGGIVGQVGNTGDGVQVKGNGFQWVGSPYFYRAGQDGVRIGDDVGPSNANGFYFQTPTCATNGRYGINVNDKPAGAPDANAWVLHMPFCHHNGSDGMYVNNSNLGGVIFCPTLESNTGYGLTWGPLANRNIMIGGDIEANTAGGVQNLATVSRGNRIIFTSIEASVFLAGNEFGNWTPVLYGSTTAGAGTYTVQKGTYHFHKGDLLLTAVITWTAHTGTGSMRVDFPDLTGASIATNVPNVGAFIPVHVIADIGALAAGLQVVGGNVDTSTAVPTMRIVTSNAGVLGQQAMTATGTLYINARIPVTQLA